MKTLTHTRDVIDLLGGNLAFRKRFKAGQTAVSEWRNIDRFPHWLHFRLLDELPIDYTVSESLFGLTQAAINKRKKRSRNRKPSTGGGRGKGGNGTGRAKAKARQRATRVVGRVHQHA